MFHVIQLTTWILATDSRLLDDPASLSDDDNTDTNHEQDENQTPHWIQTTTLPKLSETQLHVYQSGRGGRRQGRRYLKLVYQIDSGMRRLLWVGENREEKTLDRFFDLFHRSIAELQFVCSDMWRPYLHASAARAPQALNNLDR